MMLRPDKKPYFPSLLLFMLALISVNAVFFRLQIANGFTLLFGDRADSVIETALLEHWFNVVRGFSVWSETNYFYPHDKTLGYNDGFFLFGLIYSVFRSFGLDPFLSSELVNVVLKNIGFIAFFYACRRILNLPFGWALFAASLFTLSHSSFLHAGHEQLLSIAFAPLMAVLLWESYCALKASRARQLLIVGSLAGIFFSAWMLTAFYMAWFFVFFSVFLIAILCCRSGKSSLNALKNSAFANRWPLLAITALTALALAPFMLVYAPKAAETGMRTFPEIFFYTQGIKDIFDVGTDNLLFGRPYKMILHHICRKCDTGFSEHTTGIAPVLLLLLGFSFAWVWRRKPELDKWILLNGIALATLMTWLLCLHIGRFTGWYAVYQFFPGAKALRVVARYQTFLMFPVVALVVCYLHAMAPRIPRPFLLLLCGLLLLEEINSGVLNLDREKEKQHMAVSIPPKACHVFFVSQARDQVSFSGADALYPHNVDAMMIAEEIHLPTINGFSSFNPPDWDFAYPNKADYTERVKKYAVGHHLTGLCRLDLMTLHWEEDWDNRL